MRSTQALYLGAVASALFGGCNRPPESHSATHTAEPTPYIAAKDQASSVGGATAGSDDAPSTGIASADEDAHRAEMQPAPVAPVTAHAELAARRSKPRAGQIAASTPLIRIPEDDTAVVNPFIATRDDRLSTFAIDVDAGSYTLTRRRLHDGHAVPPADVRVEEFINYFGYDYAGPRDQAPFAVHLDAAPSPLSNGKHLLRIGVAAKRLSANQRQPAHLVFLVDVSGSMESPDKLELAKSALRIVVDNLQQGDTVALATYAGNTRVVLEPTSIAKRSAILAAIDDLSAGGSTSMASGMELAYALAAKNLAPNSTSRVIVFSDGDANVGATSHEQILAAIAAKVAEGVTLSTIGFGTGNYRDSMMEQLADRGNGNYYYIDSLREAKRVLGEQLGGVLQVVAKDVKLQVEMNPAAVSSYRLIGYENRDLADDDFRNDAVDAGEIGAGHTVTALYELVIKDPRLPLATVRVRAKEPRGTRASEHTYSFASEELAPSFAAASADFRFAVAVMATAEVLRGSPYAASWRLRDIRAIATAAAGTSNERGDLLALLSDAEKHHRALISNR